MTPEQQMRSMAKDAENLRVKLDAGINAGISIDEAKKIYEELTDIVNSLKVIYALDASLFTAGLPINLSETLINAWWAKTLREKKYLTPEEIELMDEQTKALEETIEKDRVAVEEKIVGPYQAFFEHKNIPMPELVFECQMYIFNQGLTEEFNAFTKVPLSS